MGASRSRISAADKGVATASACSFKEGSTAPRGAFPGRPRGDILGDMATDPGPSADLQSQINDLVRQVTTNRASIDALVRRADASEHRADASEVRADAAETRADALEARAQVDRDMIADLQRDGVLTQQHAAQMDEALKSSRTIGAAIGIIMASRRLGEAEAFEVLRAVSQNSNRKLRDLAADLVASAVVTEAPPPP